MPVTVLWAVRALLEQMQAGESVTVPAWRVPELARVLGCEPSMRVVVAPDV
jgi:hypothetical protein